VRSHPTDEHLLPFFVALGAASPGVAGTRVHESFQHGTLAMDAYSWA
jgi:4,5-DOPA dioxygenase extradiol